MLRQPTTYRVAAVGQSLYRRGELLVHVDDVDDVAAELAAIGFGRRGRHGELVRFTGPPVPDVPELAARFGGRVGPNHVFAAGAFGGRVPGSIRVPGAYFGGRVPGAVLVPGAPIAGIDYPEAVVIDPEPAPLEMVGSADPVRVGLIDTGIVRQGGETHPWFSDHLDFDPIGDVDPLDTDLDGMVDTADAHGTFVAGLILNEARAVTVKVLRVLDDGLGDDTAVAAAIGLLVEDGIRLINLSFGGTALEDSPPRVIEYALRKLPPEVVVVCSAGNFGDTRPHWPGAFPTVTAVGAVDESAWSDRTAPPRIALSSTRGSWVDAYAAGVKVVGPYCWFSESAASAETRGRPAQDFTGWARWSGTSFAAATVTGRIAQAMQTDRSLSAPAARDQVLDVVDAHMIDDGLGHKRPWVAGVDSPRPSPPRVPHPGD